MDRLGIASGCGDSLLSELPSATVNSTSMRVHLWASIPMIVISGHPPDPYPSKRPGGHPTPGSRPYKPVQ